VIFVTVGTSMPFDRLIRSVDEWAGLRGRTDVIAQIGRSEYQPKDIEVVQFLRPSEFRDHVHSAKFVVAHAGIGSIITALEMGRPIVVMPRRAYLRETRTDHQVATANQFAQRRGIIVALDERELFPKLDQAETSSVAGEISTQASPQLIFTIRSFIAGTVPIKTRK
jgi:UDP-N-acetylglucosamine transferase subunit ALG13